MDTRAEGFEAYPLDESDMLTWEAKLYLSEGTLAQELRDYARRHGQDFMRLRLQFDSAYPGIMFVQYRLSGSQSLWPLCCASCCANWHL